MSEPARSEAPAPAATPTVKVALAPRPPPQRRALSERVNPIVIQELRRNLRARLFSSAFSLMLIACVVVALVAWASRMEALSDGRAIFIAFYFCLAVVGFFVLPYNAFRSLAADREEKHWALLVLTRLTPRQILAGKIGSSLVQAMLFTSVAAPFLMFSYLLQGIDLLTVGVVGALTVLWQAALTTVAASFAAVPEGRLFRGAAHFVILGALFTATCLGIGIAGGLIDETAALATSTDLLYLIAFGTWLTCSFAALAFGIGVSRLTWASDNHALWPRLALTVQVLGTIVAAGLGFTVHHDAGFGMVLGIFGCSYVGFAGIFLSTGPDGMSRPLRLTSRLHGVNLFLPGALRGFRLQVLLALAVGLGGHLLTEIGTTGINDSWHGLALVLAAHAIFYVSLAPIFSKGPLRRLLPSIASQRIFAFSVYLVTFGVPLLVAAVLSDRIWELPLAFMNPLAMIMSVDHSSDSEWIHLSRNALPLAWPLAMAAALVCDRVLAAREREAHA